MILCTAANKVGTSTASIILHVQTPPTKAAISGPQTIQHEDESIYECAVDGGNPAPEITWTIKDHLGNTKEVAGEMIDQGLSRMTLKTGTDERMLSINCVGSNNQGIVSHTMHVNTHYLPHTVQITGPTTATPGQFAHFTCVTTETFPVPALTWKIEKSGDIAEVSEIDGEVSTEALKDGGVVAFAKIDISIEETMTHGLVQCLASLEGLGKKLSKQHTIDVITLEEPIEKLNEQEIKEDTSANENNIKHIEKIVHKKPEKMSIESKYSDPVHKIKHYNSEESLNILEDNKVNTPTTEHVTLEQEEDTSVISKQVENYEPKQPSSSYPESKYAKLIKKIKEQEESSYNEGHFENVEINENIKSEYLTAKPKHFKPLNNIPEEKNKDVPHSEEDTDNIKTQTTDHIEIKHVTLKKEDNIPENKPLWIPLRPDEDIHDYQLNFQPDDDAVDNVTYEDEFVRASNIPEATMLKQEKDANTGAVNSPVSVSVVDPFSASSTISLQTFSIYFLMSLLILSC